MSPQVWVVYAVAVSLLIVWLWSHCVEPMLRYIRAPRLAVRICLALTIVAVGAQVLEAIVIVLGQDSVLFRGVWVAANVAYAVVVALGYLTRYMLLVRFCRAIGEGAPGP